MARREHSVATRNGNRRTAKAGQHCARSLADPLSAWPQLNCRAKSGAAPTNASCYQRRECTIAIWFGHLDIALPDWSPTLIQLMVMLERPATLVPVDLRKPANRDHNIQAR